jgi:hypothetical protein
MHMSIERFWKKWYFIVPAAIVGIPALIALFVFLGGGIVMLLWNWLLPPLFGWRTITLLQGFGLLVLCRMLFGGFGGGGGGGGRHSKHMSPKDRERVRQRMRDRLCEPGESAKDSTPLSVPGPDRQQ